MAETSSSAEGRRAAIGSPSDATSPPAKEQTSPQYSTKTDQAPSAAGSGPAARLGGAIATRHFTLYVRPASTKKQGLRLAFGARAGRSTVRNRAKRQAREAHRLNRQGRKKRKVETTSHKKSTCGTLRAGNGLFPAAARRQAHNKMMALTRTAQSLLRIYKSTVSRLLPPACRFYPSCADYAHEAINLN